MKLLTQNISQASTVCFPRVLRTLTVSMETISTISRDRGLVLLLFFNSKLSSKQK